MKTFEKCALLILLANITAQLGTIGTYATIAILLMTIIVFLTSD